MIINFYWWSYDLNYTKTNSCPKLKENKSYCCRIKLTLIILSNIILIYFIKLRKNQKRQDYVLTLYSHKWTESENMRATVQIFLYWIHTWYIDQIKSCFFCFPKSHSLLRSNNQSLVCFVMLCQFTLVQWNFDKSINFRSAIEIKQF